MPKVDALAWSVPMFCEWTQQWTVFPSIWKTGFQSFRKFEPPNRHRVRVRARPIATSLVSPCRLHRRDNSIYLNGQCRPTKREVWKNQWLWWWRGHHYDVLHVLERYNRVGSSGAGGWHFWCRRARCWINHETQGNRRKRPTRKREKRELVVSNGGGRHRGVAIWRCLCWHWCDRRTTKKSLRWKIHIFFLKKCSNQPKREETLEWMLERALLNLRARRFERLLAILRRKLFILVVVFW